MSPFVDAVTVQRDQPEGIMYWFFCFGSCCVDEVAAQHYQADSIVHFGRSCLSQTSHLPVLFVFGQQPIDGADCCQSFRRLFPKSTEKVVILYDVVYAHAVGELHNKGSDYISTYCATQNC